ncbi:MAG: class I SAM-dependent methyltransferase [Deltaproteobacteria bacterium]|nr:class I SAM-dependent methyltransferase [Deltaproteobacteria bacterium]
MGGSDPPAGVVGRIERIREVVLSHIITFWKGQYDRHVVRLLSRYVPADARRAYTILDAMCGSTFTNMAGLRLFFGHCASLSATDIDLLPGTKGPPGIAVFWADLLRPLPTAQRYDLITVFKPPTEALEQCIEVVLQNLAAALRPGGYLFMVLGEEDHVGHMVAVMKRLGMAVITSEANTLPTNLEPGHRWVLVSRAPDAPSP